MLVPIAPVAQSEAGKDLKSPTGVSSNLTWGIAGLAQW